jgi:fructose-specific phosphotransferase system IIC component
MQLISGTGRGALALFLASLESGFKVPADCYTMAAHRVMCLTMNCATYVWKCPRYNGAPPESRGSGSSSTVSGTSMSGERSTIALLKDPIPWCPCSALGMLCGSTIGLSTCLKSSCLKLGLLRCGTCGWRSAAFGQELLEIDMGMWCD